jgi:hypothetical protein
MVEVELGSKMVEVEVDNNCLEVVGSNHGLVGEMVDSNFRRRDLEVGSNRHCLDDVEDCAGEMVDCDVRLHRDLVVGCIVQDDLDRGLVFHCLFVHLVVAKDVVEQELLKLLAQAQVPT